MSEKMADLHSHDDPLEHVCTVSLPGFYRRFSPSTEFREGNKIGGIRVREVDDVFMKLFHPIPLVKPSKMPDIPPVSWPCWKLKRPMHDANIFDVWLGNERKVSELVRIFQVMSLGEAGPLPMNGLANFAFVNPVLGKIKQPRTVFWRIYRDEWHIHAISESVNDLREVRKSCRLPQGAHVFGGLPDRFLYDEPVLAS